MERKWWTLAAVAAGTSMLLLDVTVVNVALPDMQHDFGASLADLQWVVNAYALLLASLLLTAGSLADRFGRRRLFAGGLVVFTVGSVLCGASADATQIALSRGLQGVGGAIMFATAFALLAQTFEGRDRGIAFGVFGAVTGVAVALGPVVGGALTSGLSWRWIFFVNVPISVVALAITLLRVDESRDPAARRPDLLGFLTFSGALAALVLGLIRANDDGWGSTLVLSCFGGAAFLLIAFVAAELLQRAPMFDFALLRVPTFVGALAGAFGISASLFSLLLYLVLYLQNVLGYSALDAGLRFLPLTGMLFLTAGIAGRLTANVAPRLMIGPGFLLIGAGLLLMRGITPASDWTHLLPGLILAGIGAGLVNVPLASTAVAVVPAARAGMAAGINSTFRQVGIATGVAALGAVLAAQLRDGVVSGLARTPLSGRSEELAHQVSTGHVGEAIASAPPALRGVMARTASSAFIDGLDALLLIGAGVAFAAAVATLALIQIGAGAGAVAEPAEEGAELVAA